MLVESTCCFIGHRTINETEELKSKLKEITEKLIVEKRSIHFFSGARADLIAFALNSYLK